MDATDPPSAVRVSPGNTLPGTQPGNGEPHAEATAIVPPPLGEVDADPAFNRVALNIRRELARQLGGAASVLDASFRVLVAGEGGGFLYQPDVIVDGDEPEHGSRQARWPKVIFELAAAGSERAAFIGGQRIHEKLPTVDVHVLVDPACRRVTVRHRQGDCWRQETLTGADECVYLPTIRCVLPLRHIYLVATGGGDEGRI